MKKYSYCPFSSKHQLYSPAIFSVALDKDTGKGKGRIVPVFKITTTPYTHAAAWRFGSMHS
jgi:hypothetical protein